MADNKTSNLSVFVQGNVGESIVDKNIDCDSIYLFAITEEGIEICAVGSMDGLQAAHLLHAMDEAKDLICNDFPLAGAVAAIAGALGVTTEKKEGSINDAE